MSLFFYFHKLYAGSPEFGDVTNQEDLYNNVEYSFFQQDSSGVYEDISQGTFTITVTDGTNTKYIHINNGPNTTTFNETQTVNNSDLMPGSDSEPTIIKSGELTSQSIVNHSSYIYSSTMNLSAFDMGTITATFIKDS